jgi:SAM-dependent methyltransferase
LKGKLETNVVLLLEQGMPIRAMSVEAPALACFGGLSLGARELGSHQALRVLEAFVDAATVDDGYERYCRGPATASSSLLLAWIASGESPVAIVAMNGRCMACPSAQLGGVLYAMAPRNDGRVPPAGVIRLDAKAADGSPRARLLSAIAARGAQGSDAERRDLSKEAFVDLARELFVGGLLSRPVGEIDLGDLRRLAPFDPMFGFTRGTPIDRYYLERFIEHIRPEVRGAVLEIGGKRANRETYGFDAATEYRAMDIKRSPDVDLVGDVHDRGLIPPGTLDAIVIFNVLEHCARPWVVAENLRGWLRVGGKVFAMVPSVQRVHRQPRDYWRPYPDGMEALFADFARCQLFVYGNPLTALAAIMGIAVQELSTDELDRVNTGYPVATCVIAEK